MTNHFDEAAKTWDMKPDRLERAQKFAHEIINLTKDRSFQSAMEFGAGTGSVSFCLSDHFSSITMIDDSMGMTAEIQKKIQSAGVTHMKARHINLLSEPYSEKHDVIYSLLVLHHIHDISAILKIFHSILNPRGLLIIADLVSEDGSFHAEHPDFDGHNGFEPDDLKNVLSVQGFVNIRTGIFHDIQKVISGEEKQYPVFFISGEKR